MLSLYKWKKNAIFISLGVVPTLLFVMLFFATLEFYIVEGVKLAYIDLVNLMISFAVAFGAAIIIIIMGNRLLQHAFTSMLEGKGLLTFILDSTGVIGAFNVRVNAPKMQGVFQNKNIPPIEDTYDIDMMHRLAVPKDATLTKAVTFSKNEETGKIEFGDPVEVLVLPEKEKSYDNSFLFMNRPVFIYNGVMNKFLSRDALAKFEKDIEIKHNSLNILHMIRETAADFRNFGRYIGEQLKPQKQGLLSSPLIKYIIMGALVGLIALIMLMFLPGLLNAGSNII